jgi:hypothetical protein
MMCCLVTVTLVLPHVLALNDGRIDRDFEGEGPPIPRIVMSAEQAVEHYGFSSIPVYGGKQMKHFAPVVAQLTGK